MVLSLCEPRERQLELVWSSIWGAVPSSRELAALRLRGRRLLTLIENILSEHERLTHEAILTLQTIRRSLQLLSLLTASVAVYVYVKRFHSSLFQSYWYLAISSKKSIVLLVVIIALFASYAAPKIDMFLKSMTLIS